MCETLLYCDRLFLRSQSAHGAGGEPHQQVTTRGSDVSTQRRPSSYTPSEPQRDGRSYSGDRHYPTSTNVTMRDRNSGQTSASSTSQRNSTDLDLSSQRRRHSDKNSSRQGSSYPDSFISTRQKNSLKK